MKPYSEQKTAPYTYEGQDTGFTVDICGGLGVVKSQNTQCCKLLATLTDINVCEVLNNDYGKQPGAENKHDNNVVDLLYRV